MTDIHSVRLRVAGLSVGLADAQTSYVIKDIDLELRAGQVLALVGESGSGKSTLGLALLGYARGGLDVRQGTVRIDGQQMLALSASELRAARGAVVAYVPQDPGTALNPARRIGRQLREIMEMRGWTRERVNQRLQQLLTEVGLDNIEHVLTAFPHQLSGGQQQRVALAMSFACRPQLIVLDEPTTGLDVATQQRILETIDHLCETYGVAAVYISHDLAVVEQIADQVAVMYAGEIVEYGPTREVLAAPRHPYTQALLRAQPSPDGSRTMAGIPGLPPRIEDRHIGCVFTPRCHLAISECASERPPVIEVTPERDYRCWIDEPLPRPVEEVRRTRHVSARAEGERPALEVKNLNASYGDKVVLNDLAFRVPAGECVAIVGESGSGKSTLSRCLVGLHENWSGAIEFEGIGLSHQIRQRPRDVLKRMQFVFQNPYASLNPRLTIAATLTQQVRHFSICSPAELPSVLVQAMRNARLAEETLRKYPHELSGGERQRVAVARALVAEPSVLICDEVTSALDVSVQASIVSLLADLQRERAMSMVFVTHNLALVRTIAHRVIVMANGRIVEQGDTTSVFESPREDYTRSLLEMTMSASADLLALHPSTDCNHALEFETDRISNLNSSASGMEKPWPTSTSF